MKKRMKRIAATVLGAVMVLGMMSTVSFATEAETSAADTTETTVAEAETEDPMAAISEFDPDGSFHARLGFQLAGDVVWLTNKGYYFEPFECIRSESGTDTIIDVGTYVDAEVAGNGTYTVSLTSSEIAGYNIMILQVATDIYKNDAISFDNFTVTINGVQKVKFTGSDVFIDEDSSDSCQNTIALTASNNWRDGYNAEGPLPQDAIAGLSGEVTIEMSFDVSGFNYDKAAKETEAVTEAVDESKADATTVVDTTKDSASRNFFTDYWYIFVIVAAVVIVVVVVLVVINNKKKA